MSYPRLAALSALLATLSLSAISQSNEGTTPMIEDAIASALEVQPGAVVEAEPDEFEDRPVFDIEILTEEGVEVEFKVDMATGDILHQWTDDDPGDDPQAGQAADAG